jgi:hypothetical protein
MATHSWQGPWGGGGEDDDAPDGATGIGGFLARSAGNPVASGLAAEASTGLGRDMGDVRVHQGAEAEGLNTEMGAEAFAFGTDIVLGGPVDDDIMMHELAHVAQQSGQTPSAQPKLESGGSSSIENDADSAAATVMAGGQYEVASASPALMCYEGGEHMSVGNAGYGGRDLTVGDVTLPAGAFTALMGDFYRDWPALETECTNSPDTVYALYQVMIDEQAHREGMDRDGHDHDHEHIDSNGAFILANITTGGSSEFLDLAETNFNHFSEQNEASAEIFEDLINENPAYAADIGVAADNCGQNVAEWAKQHIAACKKAYALGKAGDPSDVAIAMAAGAGHYLSDAFASGHMRVPRAEMLADYTAAFDRRGRGAVDGFVDSVIPGSLPLSPFIPGGALLELVTPVELPAIDLTPVRTGAKSAVYSDVKAVTDWIASKAAGFGAKVIHDHDNKNGVEVTNIGGDPSWSATGDHELAVGQQNEERCVATLAAAGCHVQAIYDAGVGSAGTGQGAEAGESETMPYISMMDIINGIPVVNEEGNDDIPVWQWEQADASFKLQVLENAWGAAEGMVTSMGEAVGKKIRDAVSAYIRSRIAALGAVADVISDVIDAIVASVVDTILNFDPALLRAALM